MKPGFPSLNILKPEGTELIRHIFSTVPGQNVMAFGVITPFALSAPGQTQTPNPDSLWEHIAHALGDEGTLDEGWPKNKGEFLASGHCYPPQGHHDQPVSASIQVGPLTKQLAVFGERRYGLGGRISAPKPFERMPLTLAHAFGGDGHAANPLGKGVDTSADAELPNVELPRKLIAAASDRPEPASFAPIPHDFSQRSRYLGDFGAQWLKTRWPHLPMDTDPRFFQASAEDQQIEGFWMGGEQITIRNMHPEHPDQHGRVPTLRPRFFIHRITPDGEPKFLELNAHADTLWLLPDQSLGLMIYRAVAPITTPDARDVNAFMVEFEALDDPELPIEYYIERFLRHMTPEAFEDIPDTDEIQAAHADLSSQQLLHKVREQKALFQQSLENRGIDEAAVQRQLMDNPHTRQFAQMVDQRNGSLSGFFNEIESLLAFLENENTDVPARRSRQPTLESVGPTPARTAPEAPDAPIATPHTGVLRDEALAAHSRKIAIARIQEGQSCSGLDLSQANLAGLDLAGADFSNAILVGANLSGAQMQGTRLQGANLQDARFDAANLAGCQLTQATLDHASFTGASLIGAILDDSDCTAANFSGANLMGASMRRATLSYAWLSRVKAARIQAIGADFSHANLEGIDLERANLDGASFSGARLRHAVLDHASCVSVDLTQADLTHASLVRCDLGASQATPGTQGCGVNLQNAILNDASWIGVELEDAMMQGVKGLNADFSDAHLGNAQLTESDLRAAIFDRADLRRANLSRSNLMEASFINADLSHCRLEDSNLYAAGFMDTTLEHANLRGANIGATILAARADG